MLPAVLHVVDSLRQLSLHNIKTTLGNKLLTIEQLIESMHFDDQIENQVFQIVLLHLRKTEILAPGSLLQFISSLLEALSSINEGNYICLNDQTLECSKWLGTIPQQQDIETVVRQQLADNKMLQEIMLDAIKLAGFHGKIFIEKSSNTHVSVEKLIGYKFDMQQLQPATTMKNAYVIVLDGYAENVSELERLFHESANDKACVTFFAHGFSHDVINTVVTNNKRGIFDIQLLVSPFELEHLNQLNDIAIASGARFYSSKTGDLISSINLKDAGQAQKCVINKNAVVFNASHTRAAVQNHVLELLHKQQTAQADDVRVLLDKRIKSLNALSVVIKLQNNDTFTYNAFRLDQTLRLIRQIASHGFIEKMPAVYKVALAQAKLCAQTLTNMETVICSKS